MWKFILLLSSLCIAWADAPACVWPAVHLAFLIFRAWDRPTVRVVLGTARRSVAGTGMLVAAVVVTGGRLPFVSLLRGGRAQRHSYPISEYEHRDGQRSEE